MNTAVFSEKDKEAYKNFLLQAKYKDALQSWEWGEVKTKTNWLAKRVGFFDNQELKGVCQILERRVPAGFKIFYIPRGPIIDWDDEKEVTEVLAQLKKFILSIGQPRTLFLRIEPPAPQEENLAEIFKEQGFRKYFKTVQPPSTLLIDLTLSEEELLKKFRRTARNLIYRSQREGVIVEPLDYKKVGPRELGDFYNVYRLTGKRFSFPLRPQKQFEIILRKMGPSGMVRMYAAKAKGLILAYGLVLLLNDRAFYIWGGSSRHEYFSKFFNYGYIWGMLKDLKASGIKTFDFWGLGSLENKKHPWYGFSLFKTAFDGQKFEYLGAFDLPLSGFYPVFKVADRLITPRYRATSS